MTNTEFTGIVLSAAMAVFPDKHITKTADGYFVDSVNVGDIEPSPNFLSIWKKDDAKKFAVDYFSARIPMVQ